MKYEELAAALLRLGFRKRAGLVYTTEFSSNRLGWLGVNASTRYHAPGEATLHLMAGVRFADVERLVAELLAKKPHAYVPPTVATPLYRLLSTSGYTAWRLRPDNRVEVADELAAAVDSHALPHFRAIATHAELAAELERSSQHPEPSQTMRLAVAWALAGDRARAHALLERQLDAWAGQTHGAAALLREFAVRFRGSFEEP